MTESTEPPQGKEADRLAPGGGSLKFLFPVSFLFFSNPAFHTVAGPSVAMCPVKSGLMMSYFCINHL